MEISIHFIRLGGEDVYINIDTTKKIIKPKLQLCKVNLRRDPIGNLSSAYNIRNKLSVGNISELSFSLPIYIDQRHKLKKTPHIDQIKERFYIKLTKGNYEEYYIITKVNDIMDEDTEYRHVECFSLGYQLKNRIVKNFSTTSLNLTSTVNQLLQGTGWTLGYVDADFDIKYRSFEISGSVLDAVIQVAETFGAVIVWDTHLKKVSFRKLESIGHDSGFRVRYGKLLKSLNRESNTDEMCTRLRGFGQNGLTINSVNPTGSNYIQSFSYFMYPFQSDGNGNVLQSSDYMSDELCLAIEAYEKKIEDNKTNFNNYLSQLEIHTEELFDLENELFDLENDLATIEDNISIANANGNDPSSLIIQKNNKLSQINAKKSEINSVKATITSIQNNINNLRTLLAEENNFTPEQLEELNQFIIEKEYSNNYIIDAKQLYQTMIEEFDKLREPKIVVNINIENLFELITEQKNWGRLNLGDAIQVEHERLGVRVQARIMEVDFDYENKNINLTIANVRDILSDEKRFIRDMYKTISSSTTLSDNVKKWNDTSEKTSEVYEEIHSTWDATKRNIVASNNETVDIGRQGIRIHDLNDPDKMVILQHGHIALTNDGGNTWKTVITPDRVVAERIMGTLLAGVNLKIDASTESGVNIFTVDQNGVTINGGRLTITGGLPPDQLDPSFKDSLVNLGQNYNGVVIDTSNGIVITRGDSKVRIVMNATRGIAIQTSTNGSTWTDRFYVDSNGNITAATLTLTDPSINAGHIQGSSINVNNKFIVDSQGNTTMNGLTATNANISGNITMTGGSINWSNINSDPVATSAQSTANSALSVASNATSIAQAIANGTYSGGTFINGKLIYAPEIYGGKITGGEILSNSTIKVTTDVEVGNNIVLGYGSSSNESKTIVFYGIGNLTFAPTGVILAAANGINLNSGALEDPSVYANYEKIATRSWVLQNSIARFG